MAVPTYSYFIGYTAADAQLPPHVDREQCDVTVLVSLEASAHFPLTIDRHTQDPSRNPPSPLEFRDGAWRPPVDLPSKEGKEDVDDFHLAPGDVLVYRGTQYAHWRKEGLREGEASLNVLLHYAGAQFDGDLY